MEVKSNIYKYVMPALLFAIIALLGFLAYAQLNKEDEKNNSSQDRSNQENTDTTEIINQEENISSLENLTKSFVASKNTKNDCYLIIENSVYAIPQLFIESTHPGGAQNIISYCGKDATSAFKSQGSHSSNTAKDYLQEFYIGELQD